MRLSRQVQAYLLLFFFDEKVLRPQKHVTSKNQLTKQNKLTLNNKGNNFLCAHKLLSVKCFCTREIFSSKKKEEKKNRLEIVLITSLYYTTYVSLYFLKKCFPILTAYFCFSLLTCLCDVFLN